MAVPVCSPYAVQRAVLVHVELPIAGLVALAAHVVQPLKQRPQLAKILQALDVLLSQRLTRWLQFLRHPPKMREKKRLAQVKMGKRKSRAEQAWNVPISTPHFHPATECSIRQEMRSFGIGYLPSTAHGRQ